MVPKVIGLIWGLYMMELRFIMKDFRFGKVRVWFDAKQHCLELVCGFQIFLRYARAIDECLKRSCHTHVLTMF